MALFVIGYALYMAQKLSAEWIISKRLMRKSTTEILSEPHIIPPPPKPPPPQPPPPH
ncbi:hypothetical protein [Ruminococcus sp.]|uniref:hypothetical protein n=1 Tax=Ruminococcus sp. TaxID=41978 RepID=UPI002BBA8811|nr:hypothetical protein [Ruminococcus sp.]HOA00048.1 hypothetical protein [Ruminococcus sp.]